MRFALRALKADRSVIKLLICLYICTRLNFYMGADAGDETPPYCPLKRWDTPLFSFAFWRWETTMLSYDAGDKTTPCCPLLAGDEKPPCCPLMLEMRYLPFVLWLLEMRNLPFVLWLLDMRHPSVFLNLILHKRSSDLNIPNANGTEWHRQTKWNHYFCTQPAERPVELKDNSICWNLWIIMS